MTIRPALTSTLGLSTALVAYSNVDAWLELRTRRVVPDRINLSHLSVLAAVLAWAWSERLGPRDIGLHPKGGLRSLRWGLLAGLAGSTIVTIFFAFPLVSREAVSHPDFRALSFGRLLWMLGGQLLLSTAVFEEVTFRGVLQAKLARLLGTTGALVVGSGIFAAWHAVITLHNLRRTNLAPRWSRALYVGAMVNFWLAGMLFGLLRQKTGHLAGSIIAHWLIVANIVLAVARPRRSPV